MEVNDKIVITIKRLTGLVTQVTISPTATIGDLKSQLEEVTEGEVELNQLRLILEENEFKDNTRTLADYNIEDGTTLFAVLKLGAGKWRFNFKVKDTRTGELSEKLFVEDKHQTADQLFEAVAQHYGLDKDEITLKAGDTVYKLEDHRGEGWLLREEVEVVELGLKSKTE